MIPQQLNEQEFILMRKDEPKRPAHKWQDHTGGYRYTIDDMDLIDHLDNGGGYAVFCGSGLIVVDADEQELEEAIYDLPNTFTVKTGGGGYHRYYFSDLAKKRTVWLDDKHLGEIQGGDRCYVVGPGSPHSSGNTYEVINDTDIAYLSAAEIEEWAEEQGFTLGSKREKEVVKRVKKEQTEDESPYYTFDITQVALPDNYKTRGSEMQGAHPLPSHGSKGGQNFSINTAENCFHCYRCDSGGGPLDLVAVMEGIIDCADAGNMSDDQFLDAVISAHKNYGFTGKIPHRAIRAAAIQEGYCTESDLEDGWKLPHKAFVDVIKCLGNQIDTGYSLLKVKARASSNRKNKNGFGKYEKRAVEKEMERWSGV